METFVNIRLVQALKLIIDSIIVYTGYRIAALIIDKPVDFNISINRLDDIFWLTVFPATIFYLFGLYSEGRIKYVGFVTTSAAFSVFLLTIANHFLSWSIFSAFSTSQMFTAACFQLFAIVGVRIVYWNLLKYFHRSNRTLVIAKDIPTRLAIVEKLLSLKGFYSITEILMPNQREQLEEKLALVDTVVIGSNEIGKEEIIRKCLQYRKKVIFIPEAFDIFVCHARKEHIDDYLVLTLQPPQLNLGQQIMKRTADILISAVFIICLSPVLLLLCWLISITSPGPVLFKQERVGRNLRSFHIYKFRSMINDAEKETGPVLATENDPRITKIGRWMRSLRLDELPQLFNVLKGDMSLVGPRPERPFFTKQFLDEIPGYSYRFAVRPGITGLPQIMAKYSSSAEQKLLFDLMYIQNYSFMMDAKICFRTLYTLLHKEQSSGVKFQGNLVGKSRVLDE